MKKAMAVTGKVLFFGVFLALHLAMSVIGIIICAVTNG